jgi:hypothetical protein
VRWRRRLLRSSGAEKGRRSGEGGLEATLHDESSEKIEKYLEGEA